MTSPKQRWLHRGVWGFVVLFALGTAYVRYSVIPDPSTPRPPPNQKPPRWKQVTDSPGHAIHLAGLERVPCKDCHDLDATLEKFEKPTRAQCLACHEGNTQTVHTGSVAEDVVECLDCHNFLAAVDAKENDPWFCQRCHNEQQGLSVHEREACGGCHRPHTKPSLQPRDCVECHQKEAAVHGSGKGQVSGASVCLDCHHPHEAAGSADAKCSTCHRTGKPKAPAPQVPASATFAGGHEKCSGCHKPHEFVKSAAKPCRSCHTDRRVLGEGRTSKHNDCRSCHPNHDPTAGARQACAKCHRGLKPSHPTDPDTGHNCLGCHVIHPQGAAKQPRAQACSSCHDVKSDEANHVGGVGCTDCHAPHGFKLSGATICGDCHEQQAQEAAGNAGHKLCTRCHDQHKPAAERPSCGKCHQEVADSAPKGHSDCKKCHEVHAGARRAEAVCGNCHRDRLTGPHEKIRGGCTNCHRPHGPGGQAKIPACASCHSNLPQLHAVKQHGECVKCHGGHSPPRTDRANCLTCHTDKKSHESSTPKCIGCHPFGRQ